MPHLQHVRSIPGHLAPCHVSLAAPWWLGLVAARGYEPEAN